MARYLRICSTLILIILPFHVWGQVTVQNAKYFYHQEASGFSDQVEYKTDSILFFYSRSQDTLRYWSVRESIRYKKGKVRKIERREGFGKYLLKGPTLANGRTVVFRVEPIKFLIRNDSLFQWSEIYDLSQDSIIQIKKAYDIAKTEEEKNRLEDIIKKNTRYDFVLVFNRGLFDHGLRQVINDDRTRCNNTVALLGKWVTRKNEYYRFEVTNDCDFWGHRWSFVISNDFQFITFGGYSSKEISELRNATLVIRNNDYEY